MHTGPGRLQEVSGGALLRQRWCRLPRTCVPDTSFVSKAMNWWQYHSVIYKFSETIPFSSNCLEQNFDWFFSSAYNDKRDKHLSIKKLSSAGDFRPECWHYYMKILVFVHLIRWGINFYMDDAGAQLGWNCWIILTIKSVGGLLLNVGLVDLFIGELVLMPCVLP